MTEQYQFMPGLALNAGYFFEVVKPILSDAYPGLTYSAALIGYGSDVLGFDTEQSMDHNWGPRLQIFLAEPDHAAFAPQIDATLRAQLPVSYKGLPTNYTDKRKDQTQSMLPIGIGPVNHVIEILTLPEFVRREIGHDLSRPITLTDWLMFPEQGLIELTRGKVFYDGLGTLAPLRAQMAFYPDDIARLKMAVLWYAIGEEEPFIGRNHALGDEIGAHLLTARLVNYLMKLCFYLERQHVPYSKWFGTAFQRLRCAPALSPLFSTILHADNLSRKEAALADVYRIMGAVHNTLGLTEPLDFTMTDFYGRPYQVIFAGHIKDRLLAAVTDKHIRTMDLVLIGVEQLTNGVNITQYTGIVRNLLNDLSAPEK